MQLKDGLAAQVTEIVATSEEDEVAAQVAMIDAATKEHEAAAKLASHGRAPYSHPWQRDPKETGRIVGGVLVPLSRDAEATMMPEDLIAGKAAGDNNCLLHTLAQLRNMNRCQHYEGHMTLRTFLVWSARGYLYHTQDARDAFERSFGIGFSDWAARSEEEGEWGDDAMIETFALVFGVQVVRYSPTVLNDAGTTMYATVFPRVPLDAPPLIHGEALRILHTRTEEAIARGGQPNHWVPLRTAAQEIGTSDQPTDRLQREMDDIEQRRGTSSREVFAHFLPLYSSEY